MTRRKVPPRRVEALAIDCRKLLVWLRGPGASAEAEAFEVALQAYRALVDAIALLPHGPRYLKTLKAAPPVRKRYPFANVDRDAESFTADELVALDKPVLTRDGVIVPAPLVPHVDNELDLMRHPEATDKDALTAILTRLAKTRGAGVQETLATELGKWQTRLSRARVNQPLPITEVSKKMPP